MLIAGALRCCFDGIGCLGTASMQGDAELAQRTPTLVELHAELRWLHVALCSQLAGIASTCVHVRNGAPC